MEACVVSISHSLIVHYLPYIRMYVVRGAVDESIVGATLLPHAASSG